MRSKRSAEVSDDDFAFYCRAQAAVNHKERAVEKKAISKSMPRGSLLDRGSGLAIHSFLLEGLGESICLENATLHFKGGREIHFDLATVLRGSSVHMVIDATGSKKLDRRVHLEVKSGRLVVYTPPGEANKVQLHRVPMIGMRLA